jgi:predicted XRE-type DNA-binding protein
MKRERQPVRVEESSGNVFADLGLPNPQDCLAKAKLADQVCRVIDARGLTQTMAAELMGLDQPKISALMHGKLKGFSAERLFRCLNDLGQEVEITIRPVRKAGRRGDIRVVAAAVP